MDFLIIKSYLREENTYSKQINVLVLRINNLCAVFTIIIINSWQIPFARFPNKFNYNLHSMLINAQKRSADPVTALIITCSYEMKFIDYFTFSCVTGRGISIYDI